MSQHWVLGWPLTQQWVFEYFEKYLKESPPLDYDGTLDRAKTASMVVQDIRCSLPANGWECNLCWMRDQLMMVYSVYELNVDSREELPRAVPMKKLELNKDAVGYLRQLLGRTERPAWFGTAETTDPEECFVYEMHGTPFSKVTGTFSCMPLHEESDDDEDEDDADEEVDDRKVDTRGKRDEHDEAEDGIMLRNKDVSQDISASNVSNASP